ncbi:unnamed protein product [Rhizoctonia solani]|uniref:Uncharacterized protein n=1 Tax=Rhizoctonia solani TaxID=456999 RepID=A0A8H3AR71_9AGAM|nr:unnamed protein product [Rhizoctonia solani]
MLNHFPRCPHFQWLHDIMSSRARPPEHKVVTGLHLPVGHPNPKYIPITLREQSRRDSARWVPDLSPVFGPPEPVAIDSINITSHADGTPFSHPLQVFFRNTFLDDSSPLNQCLHNMSQGRAIPYPWAGDIVALKFLGTRREDYCNIRDEDIPSLVYYFLSNDFRSNGSV